ncbi:cellulose biosynthesis protein BcsG [Klebsiella pneumoniae]|uniref:Cellulose biosynthesis protein BcsG n=1 Tax=Klebsiella pneumoniae TaxID=573 RepID=A0A377XIM3_KLEPN|nr:cellulose biosynthesis protein BcsG [Klebsiella pneumoniae]
MKAPHEGAPIIIDQPSSYLAVSELVVRALDGKMFSEDSVNWQQYVANLPQSARCPRTPTPSSSSIRASLMSS